MCIRDSDRSLIDLRVSFRVTTVALDPRRIARPGVVRAEPLPPSGAARVGSVQTPLLHGRPEVALERRRDTRPQQTRPGDRPRPEPFAQLVGRLDRPALPFVVGLEERKLFASPEVRG